MFFGSAPDRKLVQRIKYQPGNLLWSWNHNIGTTVIESDVLRGSSCVGFVECRGVRNSRCHFPFLLTKYLRHLVFGARCHWFSRRLLQAAQEFPVKQLGNSYISVHIRSEWVLSEHDSNMTYLPDCFRQLSSRIQDAKQKSGLRTFVPIATAHL